MIGAHPTASQGDAVEGCVLHHVEQTRPLTRNDMAAVFLETENKFFVDKCPKT